MSAVSAAKKRWKGSDPARRWLIVHYTVFLFKFIEQAACERFSGAPASRQVYNYGKDTAPPPGCGNREVGQCILRMRDVK